MAHPIRVLIVDDSVHVRAGLRALFATSGAVEVVGEARNGVEAVRMVAACQPAVVVMDLRMPVLDGVQATRLIKQRWPHVTVIALTVYEDEQAAARAALADAVVIKTSPPAHLLAAVGVPAVVDTHEHSV